MAQCNRRDFLKKAATAAVVTGVTGASVSSVSAYQPKRSATDLVTLGNSGVKVSRLAFGTGTKGGSIQRGLGQDEFTRLVRYAYDQGIRFFESAENYRGMHEMLGIALKGIPRDTYKLMTKARLRQDDLNAAIDRYRTELNTEYIDIMLLHCVRTPDWVETFKPLRDGLSEAKQKKIIAAHGASCHGLLPLRAFPGNKWLDVGLMRINHNGTLMDNLRDENNTPGDIDEVTGHIKTVRSQGVGVLGMKIMGEGQFTTPELRDASVRYVMKLGTVDAVTIGFKSTAEIDEAIKRINTHLNS